jgi:hypothetical protein
MRASSDRPFIGASPKYHRLPIAKPNLITSFETSKQLPPQSRCKPPLTQLSSPTAQQFGQEGSEHLMMFMQTHLVDSPVQMDGGCCLCVYTDDVGTGLNEVSHPKLWLDNHLQAPRMSQGGTAHQTGRRRPHSKNPIGAPAYSACI